MRARSAAVVLFVALLLPKQGKAQVYQFRTPPPQVTAAAAAWQINGEAIVFDGLVYHPTAATRPFDGNVMMQIGVFDNVPVYADATLEPFSVVYVPVSRDRMRQYECLRDGALAGTTGSQAPSFPVQPSSALPPERAVATSGVAIIGPSGAAGTVPPPVEAVPVVPPQTRTYVESIPRPRATDGVWIRYDSATWYSDGEAVPYSADLFVRIGTYRGFPVYRERTGNRRDIWIAVVHDGPLAPYAKR